MDTLFTLEWGVVAGLAAAAGVARGLSGFGIGLIMMPIGASLLTPAFMVPVLSVLDCPASLVLVREAWKQVDRRALAWLAGAALVAMPAGIALLKVVEAETLAIAVNVMVLATALALLAGLKISGEASRLRTVVTGALSGLMQGAAALPGPAVILGWVAAQVPGPTLRANIIAYFALIDAIAVVMLTLSGVFTWDTLIFGLSLLPIYLGGVVVGRRLFGVISERAFRRVVLGLVILGSVTGIGMTL